MTDSTPNSASPNSTPAPAPVDVSLLDLLYVLASGARALVGLPVLAGLIVLGLSFLITPQYTSSIVILPPQQQQSSAASLLGSLGGLALGGGGGGGGIGALAGLKNPNDQWIALLKSRTITDALIEHFKLKERYNASFQFETRDELAKRSKIEAGKDNLITISVEDEDPKVAAQLANAYVQQLQQMMKVLAVTEAGQRRVFFERQLNDVKTKLIKAETELKSVGISADVLKASPQAAVNGLAVVKAQIAANEVRLNVMRGAMTDSSPELQAAQRELAGLKEQLRRLEHSDAGNPANNGGDYIAKYREFKYQETLLELMARQYELARADEAREGSTIQVVDPANVPEWKSKPKRGSMAVLAALATLLLTILGLFTRQALRNARADPAAARKLEALSSALRGRKRRSAL